MRIGDITGGYLVSKANESLVQVTESESRVIFGNGLSADVSGLLGHVGYMS